MKDFFQGGVIGCLSLLLVSGVFAADLPAGKSLLPTATSAFQLGGKSVQDVRMKAVSISGQSFNEALQIQTLNRPPYPWNISLAAPTTGAIHKGDVLLASLMARRIASRQETGEALLMNITSCSNWRPRLAPSGHRSALPSWRMQIIRRARRWFRSASATNPKP